MNELLAMFKKSIGDLSQDTSLDSYYENFLTMAKAQLQAEDIRRVFLILNWGNLRLCYLLNY